MSKFHCRVCNSARLHKVLDLGNMPSANNLVLENQLDKVQSYPLRYYWCEDCTFFQQISLIKKEELFGGFYTYQTGASLPAVEHFRRFSVEMRDKLERRQFAVVIASNDGTEISLLKKFGAFDNVIGVDPTDLAHVANDNGLFTINRFFDRQLGREIRDKFGGADLVVANNVFAHIPDPINFLAGMGEMINDDGLISVEVHWLRSLVENLQIETLYGEHYYVWSVRAMEKIADICGLVLSEVSYLERQHGGSIRAIFRKNGEKGSSVTALLKEESLSGIYDLPAMKKLQERANRRKEQFVKLIRNLKKISIWTVPAKIPTLLNFCGLSGDEIDCAYDVTENKIGRYIPKAGILIKDEAAIVDDMPDYLIVGAWNYIEFGKKKLKWYLEKGGKMINPLTCEIIGIEN